MSKHDATRDGISDEIFADGGATFERTDWFCTYTGRKVHIFDPKPDDIDVEDIAHALAMTCRFGGHTKRFYSVAQHSVIVSYEVPEVFAREALMHDATEAYLGDVIRPLKKNLPQYKQIELLWESVIAEKLDLCLPSTIEEIKIADRRALVTERRDVASEAWAKYGHKRGEYDEPFEQRIMPWGTDMAKKLFRMRWMELNQPRAPLIAG